MRLHLVFLQTITVCNNTAGLENQTGPEMNSQCFLRSSPDSRVSPRTSPNHHISNGPFNKVLAGNRAVCVCARVRVCRPCTSF